MGKKPNGKSEQKKTFLFNTFCYLWYAMGTLLILGRAYKYKITMDIDIAMHLLFMVTIIGVQILHQKKYRQTAYFLFIMVLIAAIYLFCNYLVPAKMREFYFLLVPPVILIFIENRILKYFLTLLAFACFTIPNLAYGYYDFWSFNDPTHSLLFFAIFFIVDYFRRLNNKNEMALKNKSAELEKMNELQSKLFINVSHELRTPITLIKGQLDFLTKLTENEVIEASQKMKVQLKKMERLTDDVLDIAKMEASRLKLNFNTVNVHQLVRRLYIGFEPLFKEKGIAFYYNNKRNGKSQFIHGDPTYLERALGNIIINAINHTKKGGTVNIESYAQPPIFIIKIEDTGCGIDMKDMKKIFNLFYQGESPVRELGGTGIGLAFAKDIVQLHHGSLEAQSKVGKGSVFTLKLPIGKELKEPLSKRKVLRKPNTVTQQNNASKATQLLIVDDNAEMRHYLKRILKEYNCIEAKDGFDALKVLEKQAVNFILMDYMMPELDGYELTKIVKEKFNQIPIIMLTARGDTKSKMNVLRLGIDDYIQKPFENEELLLRVSNVLHKHSEKVAYKNKMAVSDIEIINNHSWIEEANVFIKENCGRYDFTQADLATHFNLSKSSLYRKIKSTTGLSPNNFITEVKLNQARKILHENPDILIKSLSLEVGFKHASYFSKLYTQRFGYRPQQS